MFYTCFISASKKHLDWLRKKLFKLLAIRGHISKSQYDSAADLKYAKNESLKILEKMYYEDKIICLSRKRLKIQKALSIIGKEL